jgi:hypothetical protein
MEKIPDKELDRILAQAESGDLRQESKDDEKENQTKIYFDLAHRSVVSIFHDQYRVPHVVLPDKKKNCVKISSQDFKRWFYRLVLKELGYGPGSGAITAATLMLEDYAINDAPEHRLDVRIVSNNDEIWYDLGDGEAVRIDKSGWIISSEVPILFRRFQHQKPQVKPVRGGDIRLVLDFLNIPSDESGGITSDQILALVWLVFAFIPDFPHPIFTGSGPQGSGKTTAAKIFKTIIDPSQMETLSLSDSVREMVQILAHHYFAPFDNLSFLSFDYSDLLCRTVTGSGFSKRELYLDDDDFIYFFRRVVGLNGINITPEKADLLQRSLLIGFEQIIRYEGERQFWARFAVALPQILGAIFDVLAKALAIVDGVPEPGEMRMADFARYGYAIAEAVGLGGEKFLDAYKENIEEQNSEALDASLVGTAVIEMMRDRDVWTDTPTQFLADLNIAASALGIDVRAKHWPKDPRWVWRRLKEVIPNFEKVGIHIKWHYKDNRTITITKDENATEVATPPTIESTESTFL